MNWQIKELENRSILSFSDAHSGPKLGREATIFQLKTGSKYTYNDVASAIRQETNSKMEVAFTSEFFPEEGKYHWSGHRACNIKYTPSEVLQKGEICPVCARPLTIGVENRVLKLSEFQIDKKDFIYLISLLEILLELNDNSPTKALRQYEILTNTFSTEFKILTKEPYEKIKQFGGEILEKAIKKVRERNVFVDPGYDGVFGQVKIFHEKEEKTQENQPVLF